MKFISCVLESRRAHGSSAKFEVYIVNMAGGSNKSKAKDEERSTDGLLQAMCEKILTSQEFLSKLAAAISEKLKETFQQQYKELEDKVVSMENRMDKLEQQALGDKLLIFGVPESPRNSPISDRTEITKIFKENICETFSELEIDNCFRVKSGNRSGPKPILITFSTRRMRNSIFFNKAKLKGTRIIIREYLTSKRFGLLGEAIKLLGRSSVWTSGGQVMTKYKDRLVKINSSVDLQHLRATDA